MAKASRENKDLMELGQRSRSGRVLSEYLRAIASEKTQLIRNPVTGKTEIVSNGEYVARRIWEKAMGVRWDEERGDFVTGELDLDYMKILLDRVEGKPGVGNEDPAEGKPRVAERVSEINKSRLNAMAEGSDE